MSRLPQLKRLVIEDFQEQKSWIQKLFLVLNPFMEALVQCLNQSLTIRDNFAGDILQVTFSYVPSYSKPLIVGWSQKSKPVSIHVGNCVRVDGANVTAFTGTIGIMWNWTDKGLGITSITGITPSTADKYVLTLVAFTG